MTAPAPVLPPEISPSLISIFGCLEGKGPEEAGQPGSGDGRAGERLGALVEVEAGGPGRGGGVTVARRRAWPWQRWREWGRGGEEGRGHRGRCRVSSELRDRDRHYYRMLL